VDIEQPSGLAPEPLAASPAKRAPASAGRRSALGSRWAPRLLLLLILLLGAYFRSLSLTDWDDGTGQHPDERFFTDVASNVRLPASLAELYDSARSPLNPRSYQQYPLYVYGPFPIYLTRAVAVALTPNDGPNGPVLPEQVPAIAGPPRAGIDPNAPGDNRTDFGPLVANPERAVPKLAPLIALFNPDGRNLSGYGEIVKVGRSLAALFDLGSILLVALIGTRLFGRRVGLLAALLSALAVMQIQQAHFFVDPIFSTFFCLLALYWAVRVAQGGSWLSYAALGLSIGAAMANRITLATLGLVAVVAAAVAAWRFAQAAASPAPPAEADAEPAGWRPEPAPAWGDLLSVFFDRFLNRALPLLVLAGALTVLSFRTLSPDSFTGSTPTSPVVPGERPLNIGALQGWGFFDVRPDPRFIANLTTVRSLVTGEYDFPPSQQWVGRAAYLFPWRNMVLWGMGPALGLAAWAGWALFGLAGLRRLLAPAPGPGQLRRGGAPAIPGDPGAVNAAAAWVLFVWVAFYFGWQGGQFAITMRYLLPIYGALIVFAAWLLVRLWDAGAAAAASYRSAIPRLRARRAALMAARWALPLVIVVTAGWAYAFSRIYIEPNARVMAARWLASHAPPGSYVMSEIWDDPLPLQATDASWGQTYEGISSAPYAEDDLRKYLDPAGQEGLIDQLARADYISITSNRIYDSTARLRMRYPALMRYYHHLFSGELGFELAAEITSYPSILGVKIPDQGAEEAFTVYDHQRVLIFRKTAAFSRERAEQLILDGVNWGEVYKSPVQIADRNPSALRLTDSQWPLYRAGGTWAAMFDRARWVNAAAPLVWLVLIELLGLAAFALLFRLLPRLPDRGWSLAKTVGLLLVAYAAWLLGSLGNTTGIPGRGAVVPPGAGLLPLPFAPATLWLCAAPLLAAGAAAAYAQRAELRAFWRERRAAILSAEGVFVGFLLLGLLLRWLNPDLWHPGRGGEKPMDFAYLNAVLKTAAFPPYDPWHAGGYINYYYFGFVFVGALVQLSTVLPSIGYNLAVATIFGLTALGAWGALYNLLAPLARRRGDGETGEQEDRGARSSFLAGLIPHRASGGERRALISAGLAPLLVLLLGNMAQPIWFLTGYAAQQAGRPEWAFWDATRVVQGTVNEFPFFTFLFADLHAHMIVMPISLALLGLTVAFVRHAGAGTDPLRRPRLLAEAAWLLLGGLLVGALRVTNTWDYPTYVGLAALTVAVVSFRRLRAGGRNPLAAGIFAGGAVGAAVLLGNLLFAPFTANFATESSGVELLREGLALGLARQVLDAQRTTVWELIQLYGHWLAIAAAGGLLMLRRLVGRPGALIAGGLLAFFTLIGAVAGWPAPLLLIPVLGVAIGMLWAMRGLPARLLLPLLWGVAGLGLLLLVEVVVVKGDVGRMNTVFKFGLHAWTLLALSAAAAAPWLWSRAARGPARVAVRGLLAAVLLAGLVYPVTATPARIGDRWAPEAPHTLDGAAFLQSVSAERNGQAFSLDEDAAAIAWLQRNVSGTPVIVEAHQPSYQWAGRVATYTGLPTILGWEWHQIQQRNAVGAGPAISNRQQVVNLIYSTADAYTALEQLRAYAVEYVYVGGVERATYPPEGIAKFAAMARAGLLEQAFAEGQTAVYRVVAPGRPTMLTSDLVIDPPTANTPPPLLLDTPVNQLPAVDEYAWNGLARDSSPLSALLWLLAWYALAVLGAPVAFAAFGGWRDAGAGFAKLIGWLLLGYAIWLPTSLGLSSYDRWGLLAGLLLVLAADAAALWWIGRRRSAARRAPPDTTVVYGLATLARALRERRRAIVQGELVFLAGFAALALVRALNPDLWHPVWGGEKPMEFGFLNAILRSPVMPPYDPFFSDGYINYYYYGLFLVSLPIKALGIAPAVGFNLGVATIFGLTLAAAFALAAQATRRARYGLVAAFLVGVAGNLAGVFAVGWSRGFGAVVDALRTGLAGFAARLGDWYIGPSRVIPFTINEFPAFTFLFADLHPHMIALPIGVLAAALAFRLVGGAGPREGVPAGLAVAGRPARPWPALALLALTLGALAVTNSWDFPTYALLLGVAAVGASWRAGERRGVAARAIGAGVGAVAVAVAGLALYAPFFDRYFAFVRGLGGVPLSAGTNVVDYLVTYGPALAVAVPLAAGAIWRCLAPRRVRADLAGPQSRASSRLPALGARWLAVAGGAAALAGALLFPQQALRIALAAALLLLVPALLRRGSGAGAWFALALAWVAWAVSLGVELVYIRDHLDGGDWFRMNTVFKFGIQAWTLLGLAAAIGLPSLLRGLRRRGGEPARAVGLAALAVVAAMAVVYPLAATPSRVGNRFAVATGPTLDGLAFMRQASFPYDCASFGGCQNGAATATVDLSGDAEAIDWLNRSISGTPILVQSNLWFYRAYGIRIAANTGLPTVISALHANEQRDPSLTAVRDRDVETFYSTPSVEEALRFLGKYRVNYVYVGGVERAVYPADGLAKFEGMRGTYLDPVYQTSKVQIYQVTNVPGIYARPEPVDFAAQQPAVAPDTVAAPPAAEQPADLAEYEAAVNASPNDAPLAFGLAERYRSVGRLDDAARVLERAALANPDDVGLHHLWGDILGDAGRYDEAERAYLGAIGADPSGGNYNKLGAALLRWGRLDKAEIALSQAIQADPALPEPHFQLGSLFAQRGDPARAAEELRAYLELDPQGPFADAARRLLAEMGQ